MIEIWTEDSTAGYRFIKNINKVMYNSQLKIIPHNGIGDSPPNSVAKYGGIFHHLKYYAQNNLVLLYIDKAIDKQETSENYDKVRKLVEKYKNVFIIEQVCFELGMLSYLRLFNVVGNNNQKLKRLATEFSELGKTVNTFSIRRCSRDLQEYIIRSCNNRQHYEHVAKNLLSEITNVSTYYNNSHHNLSIIKGGEVGPCWMKDCCVIPYQYHNAKICSIPCSTLAEKINDVVENSYIKEQINQINQFIRNYIDTNYRNASTHESLYKEQYEVKFKGNYFLRHIAEVVEQYGYWSYEKIFDKYMTKR